MTTAQMLALVPVVLIGLLGLGMVFARQIGWTFIWIDWLDSRVVGLTLIAAAVVYGLLILLGFVV